MIAIAERLRQRFPRTAQPAAGQRRGVKPEAATMPFGDDGMSVAEARLREEEAARQPTFTRRDVTPYSPTRPQPVLDDRDVPAGRAVAVRPSAPQPVLREPGRTLDREVPQHRQQAIPVLRRVRNALARGLTPIAAATEASHVPAGRLPQVSARRVLVAEKRLARVAYPELATGHTDVTAAPEYAEYMAAVDRITGTTGPRPVFTAVAAEGSDGE
jgi:hypothetical protein